MLSNVFSNYDATACLTTEYSHEVTEGDKICVLAQSNIDGSGQFRFRVAADSDGHQSDDKHPSQMLQCSFSNDPKYLYSKRGKLCSCCDHVPTHTQRHLHIQIHMHTHAHLPTNTHTHTHTCTYTRVCIYVHTHIPGEVEVH